MSRNIVKIANFSEGFASSFFRMELGGSRFFQIPGAYRSHMEQYPRIPPFCYNSKISVNLLYLLDLTFNVNEEFMSWFMFVIDPILF